MCIDKKNYPYFFVAFFTLLVLTSGAFFYYRNENEKQSASDDVKNLENINSQITDSLDLSEIKMSELKITSDDYIFGKTSGDIEVIVYDDPSEPFAPRYYETLKRLESEYSDRIKIALRLLPLEVNDNSDLFAGAVICAGEQGKYFEAYESMLTANTADNLTPTNLSSILKELGLDMEKHTACQSSETEPEKIKKWKKEADTSAIIGVPSTFINNRAFPGAYQFEDFTDSAGYEREGLKSVIDKILGN